MKQLAQAFVHNDINLCELWYRRHTHLHYRYFPSLKEMVSCFLKLQMEHEEVCKGCAFGKKIKKLFPSSESRSMENFDLVHSDVCGPIPVKYLGGSLYYVSFIDDFSCKVWIYFMKMKDEVFDKFK